MINCRAGLPLVDVWTYIMPPKIAKYVENAEVDVRIHPNFEARRKRTSKIKVLA